MVMSAFGVEDTRLSKADGRHRGKGRGARSAWGVKSRHGYPPVETRTGAAAIAGRRAGQAILRHPIAAGLATAAAGTVGLEAGWRHVKRKYPLPEGYPRPGIDDLEDWSRVSKAGAHRLMAPRAIKRLMVGPGPTREARRTQAANKAMEQTPWYQKLQAENRASTSPQAQRYRTEQDDLWRTQPGR